MNALELKIPPVVVLAIIGYIMREVADLFPVLDWVIPGRIIVAIIIGLAGIILILAGAVAFRMAKTTVNPMLPDKTTSIVTSGIYQVSRNPMYVGFLLILLSWAVYLANVVAFALLPLFVVYMNRFQILPEEQALLAKFGEEYVVYQKKVRRWL